MSSAPTRFDRIPRSVRQFLAAAALGFTAIAVVGSLYPWKFVDFPWSDAVGRFSTLPFWRPGVVSWIDWISNWLLFFPLGFCWPAVVSAAFRGSGGATRGIHLLSMALVLFGCTLLGAAIEFAQYWFPPRVVNPFDVQAQFIGVLCGAVVWMLSRRRVEPLLEQLFSRPGGLTRSERLWWGVLLVWFVAMILPLNISINPTELYSKLRHGTLEIVPFSKQPLFAFSTWLGLLGCALISVPVGAAAATVGCPAIKSPRSVWSGLLLSAALVCLGEFAQVFVMGRTASSLDVVAGLFGAGVGLIWRRRTMGAFDWSMQGNDSRMLSILAGTAALGLYSLFLAGCFWWPLRTTRKRDAVMRQLSAFTSRRLFHWLTRDDGFDAGTKAKLLYFVPLGLLWIVFWRFVVDPAAKHSRVFGCLMGLGFCSFLSVALELGQAVFPPHSPDATDAVLATGLAAAGLTAGWFWPRRRPVVPPIDSSFSNPPARIVTRR